MRGHALDSMASDSYLLKAPCPLHPCQCRLSKARPSASCGVVVALVLLLGAVLALAAVTYCQQVELLVVRDELHAIRDQLKRIDLLNALKTFEADASPAMDHGAGSEEDDDEDDDDDDDDDNGPFYDDVEGTNVVEGKARGSEDDSAPFVRLEPASGHVTSTTPAPITVDRRRRQVRQVAGRPQPQLKLYHMLQTPGTGLSAVAPPAEPWSQHGARQPQGYPYGRPQPMYAEHAPMAYAAPPPRYGTSVGASSTAAPIASRRSRVMDAVAGTPSSLVQQQQQHRRRHQHRLQQQQHLYQQRQQLQNLQDVTQEVPQGGRSAEVGRRWQQQQQLQQQQLQQQRWPSSTPRPSSWSATERPAGAGRWREQDPWQDRVRTTRVTDQHRP